ncbi:CpaF/VirB11 family protein [Cytobacillus kochii]|uniref:CpaF/VirB11 family protein n=1 Tax=Cytobacillus kochii TaxID=859143 RepID=UPI0024806D72|nr:CpaF/VirB11 family protein [Cytobacillus kochii]
MSLISDQVLDEIKKDLKENHSELFLDAFSDLEAREVLKEVLRSTHGTLLSNEERLNYVIQETVGLGVIDDIINKNPLVTDISFNSTDLIVETPEEKYIYDKSISEDYIIKIIQKFAYAVGKELTPKNPILDASFGYLRLNAIHKVNATYGTTMSIRVSRPRLVLTEKNFENFAPKYMLDFFKAAIETKRNILISGEVGTGKTELSKLFTSFIRFNEKVCHAEDTKESHLKVLFPEKDILSTLTSTSVSYSDLIKAFLRNNPVWIIIAEVRDQAAYELIQAVLSGHSTISTLHTVNAEASPTRLVNMAKMGYDIDEKALMDDIYRYFHLGVHVKKKKIHGKTVRYLSEVVEYLEGGKTLTIFKVEEINNQFKYEVGNYSDDFAKKLLEVGSEYKGLPKTEVNLIEV